MHQQQWDIWPVSNHSPSNHDPFSNMRHMAQNRLITFFLFNLIEAYSRPAHPLPVNYHVSNINRGKISKSKRSSVIQSKYHQVTTLPNNLIWLTSVSQEFPGFFCFPRFFSCSPVSPPSSAFPTERFAIFSSSSASSEDSFDSSFAASSVSPTAGGDFLSPDSSPSWLPEP